MMLRTHAKATWTDELDRAVDDANDLMVRVRRHLHAYPEPSGQEVETTRYLAERLREAGLAVRVPEEGRGVLAEPPQAGRAGGRIVGLRADIDALRIQDAKAAEYRSRVPGVMHACGHDAHAATVMGAALALAELDRRGALPWPVRWRAVFQPAEETNEGALAMIRAGALEGAGAMLSLHMDPSRACGTVGVKAGVLTADCDEMRLEVRGRGGHASRPHESLDPIAAAAQLITSIYLFLPRAIDTHEPVVVTIGQIAGGESYNVIPDRVEMRGTMRSLGGAVRQRAMDHIRQLARGLEELSGTRIGVEFLAGPPSVTNDPALTELVRATAAEVVGAARVQTIARPSMGGEDFAHYLARVPGTMFRLGCAPAGAGPVGLHSPAFDLDERAMAVGAKVLARAAVRWSEGER